MASLTKTLFSPLNIGVHTLQHRVIMAPLTRMRASPLDAVPSPFAAEYYGQRASEGGLIITEATQISVQGQGFPQTPGIYSDQQVNAWREVTDAVHARRGVIFLQLWHTGRISHSSHRCDAALPVAPSAIKPAGEAYGADFNTYPFEVPRELTLSEIPLVVDEFRQAAIRAKAAGFDGVEVHAANGFLIDQFLQDKSNRRSDRYGGNISNRMRFLFEVLEAVKEVYSSGEIGVRLSPFGKLGDIEDSAPLSLFREVIQALSMYDLAYLHLIEPRANVGLNDEQDLSQPESVCSMFREIFNGPLIASGGFTKTSAEALIAAGDADAVAFGRTFISNPDLVYRLSINAPLAPYNRATFYGGGAEGYTDYPALPQP